MKSREYDSGTDYEAQYSALYEPEIRTLTAPALRQGGAVLDLCCGTGIVTIPLAETGLEIVGVDIAPAMLEQAKAKAKDPTNPTFILGDALEFDTPKRFGLALMTGNAFQCFLTDGDVAALFTRVHALLSPGGVFIFDTRLPEVTTSPWTTTFSSGANTRTRQEALSVSWPGRSPMTPSTGCCTTR